VLREPFVQLFRTLPNPTHPQLHLPLLETAAHLKLDINMKQFDIQSPIVHTFHFEGEIHALLRDCTDCHRSSGEQPLFVLSTPRQFHVVHPSSLQTIRMLSRDKKRDEKVRAVASKFFLTSCKDDTIALRSLETGAQVLREQFSNSLIQAAINGAETAAYLCKDDGLAVWDFKSGRMHRHALKGAFVSIWDQHFNRLLVQQCVPKSLGLSHWHAINTWQWIPQADDETGKRRGENGG